MPYVTQDARAIVSVELAALVKQLTENIPATSRAGMLNYVISSFVDAAYSLSYSELNEAIGVLECAKLELYRRAAAPYEDKKIETNGDVYVKLTQNAS